MGFTENTKIINFTIILVLTFYIMTVFFFSELPLSDSD